MSRSTEANALEAIKLLVDLGADANATPGDHNKCGTATTTARIVIAELSATAMPETVSS
jgi:hypothetical protein